MWSPLGDGTYIQGKYCQPDDLTLITLDQAIKDGSQQFVRVPGKEEKGKRKKGKTYECDAWRLLRMYSMMAGIVWIALNKGNLKPILDLIQNGRHLQSFYDLYSTNVVTSTAPYRTIDGIHHRHVSVRSPIRIDTHQTIEDVSWDVRISKEAPPCCEYTCYSLT